MKPFNIDEYLKNPSKKVVTRDGRNVKIHCTDYIGFGPIIAKVEGNDFSQMFFSDGSPCRCEGSTYDLFFAPEKHEGWINIFRGKDGPLTGNTVFASKEEAEESRWHGNSFTKDLYLESVKVEWEE